MTVEALDDYVAEIEERAIKKALEETDSRSEAARVLGIGRTTLYRKMEKYGLDPSSNLGFGGNPDGADLLGELL